MKNWLFLLVLLLTNCAEFTKQEKKLGEYSQNDTKAKIYLVSLGATTNDVIQVRIQKRNEVEKIVKTFDNYNLLSDFVFMDSATFKIVIGSEGDISQTCETFFVRY